MVGFPHEDKKDFDDTYEVCEKSKYIKMHIFRYSNRENTPSAKMDGQIGYRTKLKRAKILNQLNNKMREEYYKNAVGRDVNIVIESILDDNYYIGTSSEYMKCKFKTDSTLNKKDIFKSKAISFENDLMIC